MSNNPAYRSTGGGGVDLRTYTQKLFSYIMPNVSEMSACKYWKNEEGGGRRPQKKLEEKGGTGMLFA